VIIAVSRLWFGHREELYAGHALRAKPNLLMIAVGLSGNALAAVTRLPVYLIKHIKSMMQIRNSLVQSFTVFTNQIRKNLI
jgi:hypothetical protein